MRELFHTRSRAVRAPRTTLTVRELIARGARRLRRARVFCGHGTDNVWDEAAALTLHALGLPAAGGAALGRRPVGRAGQQRAREILTRRIVERIPGAYLTGVAWFAGVPLHVDPRVLVPRSAIAELIERRFAPWIAARRVRRILDLGTGSGCIAIACARALPGARVDAVDISPAALAVAGINVRRQRLTRRVHLRRSDHFAALAGATYDIIVSNPPYVGSRELRALPPEYRHEPRVGLAAGNTGLDSVRIILRQARRHLRPGGLLIVEVGNTEAAVRRAFARVPFVWLQFERGGGGVFLLTREQLQAS
ncbi:MAG TPA: 50S ribosomal protein L3 N(5)-glutamine methyltransferase [Steroidobacteraceae bacterium]|nr:50S ribosomal protein L3 N(5)-glutamine methyltransferase [Steroidobacteraceae bacterium]